MYMRVAIICDWLVVYAGAERVVSRFCVYPQADLFCLVDFYPKGSELLFLNKGQYQFYTAFAICKDKISGLICRLCL